MSDCFEFTVDCVAPSAHFELQALLGQPMTLRPALPEGGTRAWHGYVTRAAFLGGDGGPAHYRLHLGLWLARRRNCLLFQALNTRAILERVFADYPPGRIHVRSHPGADPMESVHPVPGDRPGVRRAPAR